MEQIPISAQKKNNNNFMGNYIIQKNNMHHGKSSTYSSMKNIFQKGNQIILENDNNNYTNQINNYKNYKVQIPIQTDLDINNYYNRYNVTNNFYGNQIINNNINNINYYTSSRNVKEIKNINNNIYINNNNLSTKTQEFNNNTMQLYNYNNNNYMIQAPKTDINYIKRNESKDNYRNIIKNIDINMDYQEINNNLINNNIKITNNTNDDDISYFDISNFKSMKNNNVKMTTNPNYNIKNFSFNSDTINNNNNSRKSSKVKNKINSRIPYNKDKIFISDIKLNNDFKFNTGNTKKTMSKIPINMKKKLNETQKIQKDDESIINEKLLYNTNTFTNKDALIEYEENKTYRINDTCKFINKDNNLDDTSENFEYKDIKKMNSDINNNSKFKFSTERNDTPKNNIKTKIKKLNILSINNTDHNYLNNENINDINIDYLSKRSKNVKDKKIIYKHSKAKSNLINKQIIKDINKENEKIEENDLNEKINLVKIEKIESKLINKKIQIKKDKKKLNKSQSNETMNVSEMSNDEKITKINVFSTKIKNNIFSNIEKNKDHLNETKKIKDSKINNNNININDIIKNNQSNNKDIKNISYISKSKKEQKTKKIYNKEKNYFRKCKYKSIAGKDSYGNRKINQDLYLVQINFINIEGFNLYGVLDGHGENGHKVAIFTRDFIIDKLTSFFNKHKVDSLFEIYPLLKKNNFSIIKDIYQEIDNELLNQNFNSNFSGTTCIIVFQIGDKLICSNVGDSRAILIYTSKIEDKDLSSTKIYELSYDQKPDIPKEKKRIYSMGGIVDQMLDNKGKRNGPFRVWDGNNNYPGLAMSRSIGDLKGKKCGLISEPEIIEYNLDQRSKYMVICSDGVWEFLNNEDIMKIGIEYYLKNNIDEYLDKIIKVSEFWWEKEDTMRDDITAVIVFF
jgi:serine/threonine protein phosphatase PrpC